jgi:predicted  nucleic acid-binding Zn-ribbon protein
LSDFALRFGLALVVVTVASAAVILSRWNYAKSANLERNIDAFRLEFRRSIDASQAATIKIIAKTIHDNIFSVIKPIDSTVRDLDARLARLEKQHADAATAQMPGTQILDVRLARLEEHADASAIQVLDARLARLEEHTDATALHDLDGRLTQLEERADATVIQDLDGRLAKLKEHTDATTTQIATTQKQTLEENERIAAQVVGLKRDLMALNGQQQNLTGLSDQLLLIQQTIDGASVREQDIKNSIETINSRVLDAEARADQLSPRLLLEEKARKDLGNLISLFVKRLKKVNANATELALRLSDLECRFRLKATQIEGRHILERTESPSTSTTENPIKDATLKAADGAGLTTEKSNGENGGVFEPSAPGEKSGAEAGVDRRRGDTVIADAITPSE